MALLIASALHPTVSVDVTPVPQTAGVFRTNINANIAAVEAKADLVCASLEKLQSVLGNGLISGGAAHLGTGLTIHVAALAAFVGTWVAFNAEQTVTGFTDEDTTYLYLRQDGTWTTNLTGVDPTDTATHGAFLLFAEVDATSAATCAIRPMTAIIGGLSGLHTVRTITSADSPFQAVNERVILANSTSDNITIGLPTAVGQTLPFTVKKIHASNTVTIDPSGAQTIDGSSTRVLSTNLAAVTLMSDGAKWVVVGSHTP